MAGTDFSCDGTRCPSRNNCLRHVQPSTAPKAALWARREPGATACDQYRAVKELAMALNEEQRNPWRAIVAGGDYNLTSQDWEDLLTELDSLYPERTNPGGYEAQRDADRLDFLDKNRSMNMGWSCGVAPAGNVSITSVICGKLNIREAIDSAIASVKGGA